MRFIFLSLILLFFSNSVFSLDVTKILQINKAVYSLYAPPPFGELKVTFDSDIEGNLYYISVDSDVGYMELTKEKLNGVRIVGTPEFSYNYSNFKKTGSLREIQVFLEFGEYMAPPEGGGYQKKILGFSISDLKKIELLHLGHL